MSTTADNLMDTGAALVHAANHYAQTDAEARRVRAAQERDRDLGVRKLLPARIALGLVGDGWNRLLTEIGRFMAVGGIATFAAFVIFNFLVHGLYLTDDPWLPGHPVTAFVIANFVGMVISYRLSRYWTFKHRPPQHADGGRTAYFVINTVTMLIPMACLWLSRNVLGLDDPLSDNLAGVVIGSLLGQVARFYLFREYVFQKPADMHLPAFMHWGDEHPEGQTTDSSTSGRAQPPGPGAAGG